MLALLCGGLLPILACLPAFAASQPSPFDQAFKDLDIDALKKALDAGANPNEASGWIMRSPLNQLLINLMVFTTEGGSASVAKGEDKVIPMLELLMSRGAKAGRAEQLLEAPVICGHARVAGYLLDNGSDPNQSTEDGTTPLYLALFYGRNEIADLLLKHGAKPMADKDLKQVLFVRAAKANDTLAAMKLVKEGIPVSRADVDGKTALMEAVEMSNLAMVWYLLDHGANPNVAGKAPGYGKVSPIHIAVFNLGLESTRQRTPYPDTAPCAQILRLLLAYGGDVSSADFPNELTPLHTAADYGIVPAAKILIDAGAKVMPRDSKGKTPLDHAKSAEMIKLLKDNGAKEQ
jgi:ankyrin repeat protein